MEKLKDLLEATSLPGLPLLIKSKSLIVKLIWLLFISLFGTGCVYFTRNSLLDFFSYNTVTSMNIIKQNETQFPTVSFCVYLSNLTLENIPLNDYIISCKFDFKDCNLDKDFKIYSITRGDLCFRFNSDQNSVYIQNYSAIFRIDRFSYDSGLQLASGYSYIQIDREFIQNLPLPYNECIKQDTTDYVSNLFQHFKQINNTYLQKDCFDFCIEEVILKQCNHMNCR